MYYECLKKISTERKSNRCFTNKAVSKEDIESIKSIAYTSPYASGRKNWELVVIDQKEIIDSLALVVKKHIDLLETNIRKEFKEVYNTYSENFIFFKQAPVLIIPTFRISPSLSAMTIEPDAELGVFERDNVIKSISCVTMLVLLAAQSLGLGSCYMTGPLIAEKEIVKIIKIKNGHSIGAIIPIGYS
jgi:nitroreductase